MLRCGPCLDASPLLAYHVGGTPIIGEPSTRSVLACVSVAKVPREPRVCLMGDKSPRSKDKNKKQGKSKKAKSQAKRDKKQAPPLPSTKKS